VEEEPVDRYTGVVAARLPRRPDGTAAARPDGDPGLLARPAVVAAALVPPGSRESTDVIHTYLRSRILSGELAAGSELSQAGVAKECGVSRGPVREAFRLLQNEGLIEAAVNQRARVTGLSVDDVEHVYALRVPNEALALTVSVPRFAAGELDELDRLVAEVGRSESAGFAVWEERHQRFHSLLVSHAGDRMRRSLAQWAEHTERYRRVYVSDAGGGWTQGAREHAELARLCRERDGEEAARLLARHLSRAALTLVASIDPTHDPVLLRAAVRQVASGADQRG
jgi:DNA-binding GntR family transcriptional regulator